VEALAFTGASALVLFVSLRFASGAEPDDAAALAGGLRAVVVLRTAAVFVVVFVGI
jgi:hypothetical protein